MPRLQRCSRNIRQKSNRHRPALPLVPNPPIEAGSASCSCTHPQLAATQLTALRSEQPSNLEEELMMPGIAIRVGRFHRPENRFHDNAYCTVSREARGLVYQLGLVVHLRRLIDTQEIDAATQQRWQ